MNKKDKKLKDNWVYLIIKRRLNNDRRNTNRS